MQTPLVPVFFPVLGARDCVAKFQYLTSFGGGYAAKWHASWPILGVTKGNSLRVNGGIDVVNPLALPRANGYKQNKKTKLK